MSLVPVRFPVLLIEGLPTTDNRVITPLSVHPAELPLPILRLSQTGTGPERVGHIEAVKLDHGPGVSRRSGGVFPEGTFVWSATGVIDLPRDQVELMTRELVPGTDLRGDILTAELPDGQVFATMSAATLLGVSLVPARHSVWPDVYWEVCP